MDVVALLAFDSQPKKKKGPCIWKTIQNNDKYSIVSSHPEYNFFRRNFILSSKLIFFLFFLFWHNLKNLQQQEREKMIDIIDILRKQRIVFSTRSKESKTRSNIIPAFSFQYISNYLLCLFVHLSFFICERERERERVSI